MSAPRSKRLSPPRVFTFLAAIFVLHVLFRVFLSSSAELDEAEQLVLTQDLRWGYGVQPPLYTWLQVLVFTALGTNVLALVVLKHALLFSLYLFVFLAARETAEDTDLSSIAMLSLVFIPPIAWEAHRDLTHSVLATAAGAATALILLRLFKTREPPYYVMLGLCAGLGILSKYNYAVTLVALLAAAVSVRTVRRALSSRWLLLTLLLCLAVTAPHLYWLWDHSGDLLGQSHRLRLSGTTGYLRAYAGGLWSLIRALAVLLGPLVAVHVLLSWRELSVSGPPVQTPYGQWLKRTLLAVLLVCMALLVAFQARFRSRWLLPTVFPAVIYLVLQLRSGLTPETKWRLAQLARATLIVVLVALPANTIAASLTGRPTRLSAPFDELSEKLKARGLRPRVIAADSRLVGGNLKLFFKDSLVIVPELSPANVPTTVDWLVAWDATEVPQLPPRLAELVVKLRTTSIEGFQPAYVEAPFKYFSKKTMKLGWIRLRGTP